MRRRRLARVALASIPVLLLLGASGSSADPRPTGVVLAARRAEYSLDRRVMAGSCVDWSGEKERIQHTDFALELGVAKRLGAGTVTLGVELGKISGALTAHKILLHRLAAIFQPYAYLGIPGFPRGDRFELIAEIAVELGMLSGEELTFGGTGADGSPRPEFVIFERPNNILTVGLVPSFF